MMSEGNGKGIAGEHALSVARTAHIHYKQIPGALLEPRPENHNESILFLAYSWRLDLFRAIFATTALWQAIFEARQGVK